MKNALALIINDKKSSKFGKKCKQNDSALAINNAIVTLIIFKSPKRILKYFLRTNTWNDKILSSATTTDIAVPTAPNFGIRAKLIDILIRAAITTE